MHCNTVATTEINDFWATVTSNGLPYAMGQLFHLSILLITLVYCGQTVDGSRCHLVWM